MLVSENNLYYYASLVGGERSHERIWSLALSCWFLARIADAFFFSGIDFDLGLFLLIPVVFPEQF